MKASIVAILLMMSMRPLSCSGIKVTLFMDLDTYLARGKDIVIAIPSNLKTNLNGREVIIDFADGLRPVEVDVLRTLKGNKQPGKQMIATIYPVNVGKTYLLYSLGGSAYGTDFLAIPELSVVEISDGFDLARLNGKPLREQVRLVFDNRLQQTRNLLKSLEQEKDLLESAKSAAHPPPAFEHGLSSSAGTSVKMRQLPSFQLFFGFTNASSSAIEPQIRDSSLRVNGKLVRDWPFIVSNGPRDARWESLPAGDHLFFGYQMGEQLFPSPGAYEIIWTVAGRPSCPLKVTVTR